jgi:hypothetical protein
MAKPEIPFQIRYDGQSWSGAWRVSDRIIHVTCAFGEKAAPVGGDTRRPRTLAEVLLREIVMAHLKGRPAA